MSMGRFDIFRFMAIREPDKLDDVETARINASGSGKDTSLLLRMLNEAKKENTPLVTIEKIATDYVNKKLAGATVYTTSLKALDPRLSHMEAKIYEKSTKNKTTVVKNEIARLTITTENLVSWKKRLDDSFNAALILRKERGADLRTIERAIRTLHVVTQVKIGAIADNKSITKALTKTITVSKSIISNTSSEEVKKNDEQIKHIQENKERVKKAIEEYDANSIAIKELTAAYDKDWEIRRRLQSEEITPATEAHKIPAVYSGIIQKTGRWLGILPESKKSNIPANDPVQNGTGFQTILAEDITNNISQNTKERLKAIGSSSDKIEASYAITRLEQRNLEIATNLHSGPGNSAVSKFGEQFDIEFDGNTNEVYVDPNSPGVRFTPGKCTVSSADAPIKKDDSPFKHCRFNSLGVGELQVVKQKLIGYEIGEIAHIENVMASENRSRNHRTLHRTEEFNSFEFEREEETERDLETTTRFELQREVNNEVQESTQKEAGITVSGSYGPSVEFSANAGIATDSSSSKAESLSTSYSKAVIDRSVHRIQEKIKEKRTLLTIDEVEVINKHSFKNQESGAVHINGIYSWVNKKYEAQVFNYGIRELVEVIIPEPAAFIRHLATRHPKEGSTISKPLKPGYCVGRKFIPLSPGTLTERNYLDWVSAYNIQDIKPPPPTLKWKTTVLKSESTSGDESDPTDLVLSILEDDQFTMEPGYVATEAWFCVNLIGITTHHTTTSNKWYTISSSSTNYASTYGDITIGQKTSYIQTGKAGKGSNPRHVILNKEDGKLPIAASVVSPFPLNATVEVKCLRTNDVLWKWKISTFNAIMNRYEILKNEYEEAISDDELFNGVDIQGRNPIENQKIILNELKRQVITQLTGQTYEGFDAMQENVGEYGYPQQDVDEAWSEGRYIRFVEQAFEWENLQYLFYPYYWGKKKDWPITSQLEDSDPLFQSFLQAGSCRLNIAVRPGFVVAVNTFLSTGKLPWDSNTGATFIECLDTNDLEENVDPFLSITEEMKAQQGAVYFKSTGTVTYDAGDPKAQLRGQNTSFEEDDLNREINIKGEIYMIKSVNIAQQTIILDADIDTTVQGVTQFSIGAKAIGVPWIVTVPTSLVILGDGSDLPKISVS